MTTKFCPDCRSDLPADRFTRDVRQRDGLAFYCRQCANARQLASRRRRLGPPRTLRWRRPQDIPEGHKWCAECDTTKPLDEFPRNRTAKDGRGSYCKPCHNRITRQNREKNGGARKYHLRRRYGITAEHADRMLAEQDGLCAICREAPAAHVDHDHETGRVRGLLCFNCNGALGQFRDRADLMLRAVVYLRRDDTARFVEPPSNVVGFSVGFAVGPTDPRPEGEPWPVEFDDEPGAA